MSNLIPFDTTAKLPAHLQAFAATEGNEFGGSGAGFPVISIKGKVFSINRNGEKTLVTKPRTNPTDEAEPAPAVEVVILDVGPKGGFYAKTFYAEGFVEGSTSRPTCYSNDGVTPAGDAQEKQGAKCALCPQNAVGSGATQQNPKARACKAAKLLAVAPAGQLNDPMLLRVPGASVIPLAEYGEHLAKRGVKAAAVVTRIGFDYSVAYPALTFKAMGFVTPEMVAEIAAQKNSPVVKHIIGDKAFIAETDELIAIEAKPAPTSAFSVATVVAAAAEVAITPSPVVTPPPVTKRAYTKKAKPPVEAVAPETDDALDSIKFDL